MGGRGAGGGGRGRVYTYRCTVTTNDFCIKMGSDESHFNVSLIVRDKVTRPCPQNHNFWRERRAEAVSNRGPSAYQPTALPLGQTGSQNLLCSAWWSVRGAMPTVDVSRCSFRGLTSRSSLFRLDIAGTGSSGWKVRNAETRYGDKRKGLLARIDAWTDAIGGV